MTNVLEQALTKLSQLPENQQEAIAYLILAEIEDEKRWAENFANSQDQLAQLAEEAIAEFKQGKTKPLNF
ncbi:MAG: hypothetical protein F6K24_46135 [Okeania sp. SIO2D1]|uniref:hypothetical protein n=1 Tax=Okeania sp. SIO2C9 TaxID=2607791 RepID=UPI0013BB59E7|nr:hypothetical protein [Okeania sp. SIO2C9]NEQ75358.1 hypothetical protein [Okeania sp. SIO2C9]NES72059.1 hypothetical protein [Okeania sp. SIO2D1]